MAHAEQWVNAGVIYSQGPWSSVCPGSMYPDPWFGGVNYRPDCSGFVSAVWELPAPGHTTYSFAGGPWNDGVSYEIALGDLQPGDALNFGGDPGAGTGHVRLFGGWAGFGVLWGYEESSCGQPAHYWEAPWSSMAGRYIPIRRVDIAECNAAPTGFLDGAPADGSHVGGWAQDPDAPTQALNVHVYFGGPTGDPAAMGVATTANGYRADLCTAIGSCTQAFDVTVPLVFRDGAPHPVYAYTFDAATGTPVMLGGCPFTLQGTPPAIPAGVRRWVTSESAFNAWKFSYPWVAREPDAALMAVPEGPPFPATPLFVRADDGTPHVWMVDGPERRHLVDATSAAAWQVDVNAVPTWPAAQVYALTLGKPVRAAPFVAMGLGGGAVYVVDDPPTPQTQDGGSGGGTGGGSGGGGTGASGDGGTGASADGGSLTDAGLLDGVPSGGSGPADGGTPGGETLTGPTPLGCGCSGLPTGAPIVTALLWAAALASRVRRRKP